MSQHPRPRVGISSCLLGQPVRYDGRDKRCAFLVEQLGPHVDWVPVCPELEVGMGVPRESVRLVHRGDRVGMYGTSSARNWTAAMEGFARDRADRLAEANLCGYILKARSPSCGLADVPRYAPPSGAGDLVLAAGPGLFAVALRDRLAGLPLVEETVFDDPLSREAFLTALFAAHRLAEFWATSWTSVDLASFHRRHEMLLFAHHEAGLLGLAHLVAQAETIPREDLRARYHRGFLEVLRHLPSVESHARTLERLACHLSGALDDAGQRRLAADIADTTRRVETMKKIAASARKYDLTYVCDQLYLEPFPASLFVATDEKS